MLTSLGSGFSGVIIGSVAVFVIYEARAEWFRKVRPPMLYPKEDAWRLAHDMGG